VEDRTERGRKILILTITDEYSRECLAIRVVRSIPAVKVLNTMEHNIIFPKKVLEFNLACLVPFIEHSSLGSILSRIIDPGGRQGYGYYILTEGYNFVGFVGFVYVAFVFVVGLCLLESFFTDTNDVLFSAYLYAIIAFVLVDIVRGQSVAFLKGLYLYFLPAIFLFKVTSRQRVYLVQRGKQR